MSFTKHIFFCTNQRDDKKPFCNRFDSSKMRKYAKQKLVDANEHGDGKIRVNSAGCLGKCDYGPVVVVYPEAVWYTWVDEYDVDEIIEQHLRQGKIVERLLIKES